LTLSPVRRTHIADTPCGLLGIITTQFGQSTIQTEKKPNATHHMRLEITGKGTPLPLDFFMNFIYQQRKHK